LWADHHWPGTDGLRPVSSLEAACVLHAVSFCHHQEELDMKIKSKVRAGRACGTIKAV
jgi:hypothetical protein